MRRFIQMTLAMAGALGWSVAGSAQTVGTYRWQLLPYCNVLTLTITQQGSQFLLDGTDDQCSGGAAPAAARGLAYPKASGAIGFGVTIVTTPGARPVHLDAEIAPPAYSGTWSDSGGQGGTLSLALTGAGSPAPRPGLGTLAIADGSITAAKLAPGVAGTGDITAVTAGTGLSGGAISGEATVSVAFAGTGAATTAARSDHSHTAPSFVLDCAPTTTAANIAAGNVFNVFIPACPASYTLTGTGCRAGGFNQADWSITGMYVLSGSGLQTVCSGTNTTGGVITIEGTAQCCRVVPAP